MQQVCSWHAVYCCPYGSRLAQSCLDGCSCSMQRAGARNATTAPADSVQACMLSCSTCYLAWRCANCHRNTPGVVKQAIAVLKATRPNTRVLVSVGGSSYTNWVGLSSTCIQAVVEDLDLDGLDLDYEPSGISCSTNGITVSCNTDAQSVAVATALRNLLPRPTYLMGAATWHIGMYGEGAFATAKVRRLTS